jgi:transcriptional regulator with XRE-family HTH domain
VLINSIDANARQEATFLVYPDPPPEDFGTRLKRLAKERGLSNKALAKQTGAHEVTVSRWMTGAIEAPQGETLLRLAEIFDVSPSLLLKGPQKVGARKASRRKPPGVDEDLA